MGECVSERSAKRERERRWKQGQKCKNVKYISYNFASKKTLVLVLFKQGAETPYPVHH